MKDWAVILGSSSGFGAATCRALASRGINIYGIHLDRKAAMDSINSLVDELKSNNVEVHFKNMSATDADKRRAVIDELKSIGNIRVKILMHSLAFGTLKPVIDMDASKTLQQRQVEMTLDVMASSILYWSQELFQAGLLQKGSQIFAMTSAGSHRQWKAYGGNVNPYLSIGQGGTGTYGATGLFLGYNNTLSRPRVSFTVSASNAVR